MDKEAFINLNEPWWLVEREADPRIMQAREDLGSNFGWDRAWPEDQLRVQELFGYLEASQPRLLGELDYATDVEMHLKWLQELIGVTTPPSEQDGHADQEPAVSQPEGHADQPAVSQPEPAPTAQEASAWDENRHMLYRVGPNGNYEFAFSDDQRTVRPGADWMSDQEALSAAQDTATPAPASSATGGDASALPPATWDPTWGMFLRYVDGNYEYALSSVLADEPGMNSPAGEPDGNWHKTAEAASSARKDTADLKEAFSELVADPEIPISQEQFDEVLKDPNFQQQMSNAEAELEAELESELASVDDEG